MRQQLTWCVIFDISSPMKLKTKLLATLPLFVSALASAEVFSRPSDNRGERNGRFFFDLESANLARETGSGVLHF